MKFSVQYKLVANDLATDIVLNFGLHFSIGRPVFTLCKLQTIQTMKIYWLLCTCIPHFQSD